MLSLIRLAYALSAFSAAVKSAAFVPNHRHKNSDGFMMAMREECRQVPSAVSDLPESPRLFRHESSVTSPRAVPKSKGLAAAKTSRCSLW
jgi:hypothetical protein